MQLSERFDNALVLASRLHRAQHRKGSGVPYVSHLMAVSSLVLENGGDETQAIAALLHDAAEDQGGRKTLNLIESELGPAVAAIVEACSDNLDEVTSPGGRQLAWRARKERYFGSLESKPPPALLVICADKFHNASCIVEDFGLKGPAFLEQFAGGRDGVAWYYGSLGQRLPALYPSRLSERLADRCRELVTLAGDG